MLALIQSSCNSSDNSALIEDSPQLSIVRNMIEAVNEKNAAQYVEGFSDSVKIYIDAQVRLSGKDALIENRSNHFESHPEVYSEIQHLVEIDNKVVLHDKVWLEGKGKASNDIVEVFTFENGVVVRMDVIQPNNLLNQ